MSSFLRDTLSKHMAIGIQNSPETMSFIREQVNIIYQEERQKWFDSQPKEEIDKEYFCEFYNPTEKKALKYLEKWLTDLSRQGGFKIHQCPNSIVSSFDYMIDSCLDYIMEYVTYKIIEPIMEDLIYEEEKNYEINNLPETGVSK